MKFKLIKRENASDLILILMISALVTLLSTRFILDLFNWPTISFGVWHIAHVIWGGVFMLIGILLVLTNHGEQTRRFAAVIGGAGWGLFIDEIGKYLTKENDYWFQPAIIFIYISFILLYLIYRYFEKTWPEDPKTLLYGVINKLEEIVEGDLQEKEKKDVIKKLNRIIDIEKNKEIKYFAINLKNFINNLNTKEEKQISWWQAIFANTKHFSYNKVFKKRFVLNILGVYAGVWAIDRIQETIRIITNAEKLATIQKFYNNYDFISKSDFYMIALKIGSDLIAAMLFLSGLYYIATKKRSRGLRFFQLGLIVSIFLSSVFKLYFEQFSEIFMLSASIALLAGISRLKREKYA